jgi:RNA polymerase sigma-70 factor (ECF subfamily)
MNPMQQQAMKQQLVQLGGGAHALAISILGNPDDAADAVHDAFATVLGRPGAYDASKGPLKPWFLRVVRNRCIDQIRRRQPTDDNGGELVSQLAGPEQLLENDERDRGLQRALASLHSDQRQIIVLRDYMDLSYGEISDVLDIAAGTVMSRLHRARMALREALEQRGD